MLFQFERLEAVNKLQKEREMTSRLKAERDQTNEELRRFRSQEMQRDQEREAERLSNKETVRQVDRQREDLRMKLVRYFVTKYQNNNFNFIAIKPFACLMKIVVSQKHFVCFSAKFQYLLMLNNSFLCL